MQKYMRGIVWGPPPPFLKNVIYQTFLLPCNLKDLCGKLSSMLNAFIGFINTSGLAHTAASFSKKSSQLAKNALARDNAWVECKVS